ncbi:MAG: hypothetical protein JXR40_12485 [Pontiellaceae bacterium]|nr:hypothetical protein [Pontiellaceae bacterium]
MFKFRAQQLITAGLLLPTLCATLLTGCSQEKETGKTMDKLFTARKSDLMIGTLLRGTVNAKKKHKLSPESAYRNKLTWIEKENTSVKKGDVVIRFETQELLDEIAERREDLETQKKNLEVTKEEKRILLSENQSSLRVSSDRVVSAEEDYARYYKYDGKKAKDDMVKRVESSELALESAKDDYREQMDLISNTIFDNEAAKERALERLEQRKATVDMREQDYDDAKFRLKIFKKYTYPNTLTTKKNQLEQAELNHEKVLVSTASRVIQKDEEIARDEARIARAESELARLESYIPMMEIKAPVDGILVYGDVDRNNSQVEEIEVGMECHRNRVIATIPEMDNLIVNFDIPEQFRHRIKSGAKAVISPDSIPSLKISGTVDTIAVVPVNQVSWDTTSPKIYASTITLDQQNPQLVSGMSVQIEVIDEVIENAINIPIEAVFDEDGETFVYIAEGTVPKKQGVTLGKSNDQYVHVIEGIEEGDKVFLYRPHKLEASE